MPLRWAFLQHKKGFLTTQDSLSCKTRINYIPKSMTQKKVYFLSDAHLGSWAIPHQRMQERRLVNFLDEIKERAAAVYFLGDMFDFWYEWKYAVPKGYTRFLGKVSELSDMGVDIHFFTGNHDIWAFKYLEEECGATIHRDALTTEILGKVFFLAHGDGLGDPDPKFKVIRGIFHNRVCQWLFSTLHPRISMWFGQTWAKHSRLKHSDGEDPTKGATVADPPYMGEDREHLVLFTKAYMKEHPDVDFFVYGHRHIELDLMLSHSHRMLILGDWISQFTYASYDGEHLLLNEYEEGESVF